MFIKQNKQCDKFLDNIINNMISYIPKNYYDLLTVFNEWFKNNKIKKQSGHYDPKKDYDKINLININTINYKKFIKLDKYIFTNFDCFKINFDLYIYYDSLVINNSSIDKYITSFIFRIFSITYLNIDNENFVILNKVSIKLFLHDSNRTTYLKVNKQKDIIEEINNISYQGCYNCASGYTMKHKEINIVCTRLPEIFGLLTHELLHLYGMDLCNWTFKNGYYNMIDPKTKFVQIIKPIEMKYNINNIILYEVFCNTNATILHTLFNTFEIFKNKFTIEKYKKLLKIEILYSIYHSAKIIYFLGYKDFSFFETDKVFYYQKAALFEYTIMRSFLLLIDYLNIFNKNQLFSLNNNTNLKCVVNDLSNLLLNKSKKYSNIYEMYKYIFNWFMTFIEKKKYNLQNMEYFCIDVQH